MKKTLGISIIIFSLYSCISARKYNEHINTEITVKELHRDIEFAKKKLLTKHVDIDWYHPKEVISFRLDSFKKSIYEPKLPNQFSIELLSVVSSFGHAHTYVNRLGYKWTKEQKKKYKNSKNPLNLLTFKNAENRIYLDQNYSKDSTIVINSELLAIDGYSYSDFLKENASVRRGDGYTNVLNQNYIAPYYIVFVDNKLRTRDSVVLTLKKNDSVFNQVIKREFKEKNNKNNFVKNDSVSLIHQPKIKLTKEEKLIRKEKFKHRYEIEKYYAYDKTRKKYNRALKFPNPKDSTTVILDINSFTLGHHKKAYDYIFDSIQKLGTKNLILDLRENGGGNAEDINYLFAHLTTKNTPQIVSNPLKKVNSKSRIASRYFTNPNVIRFTLLLPYTLYKSIETFIRTKKIDGEYYYSSTKKKDFILKEKNRFKGNLYVLTSGKTYSAASLITSALQAEGKAIIVGEETSGDYNGTVAGFYTDYRMPNSKIEIKIPMMVFKTNQERDLKGRGVIPNIPIDLTFEDLLQQKDPQLDWILKDIQSKNN